MNNERKEGIKRQYLANLRSNIWWQEFIKQQIQQYKYYKNKLLNAQTIEEMKVAQACMKNILIALAIQRGNSNILEESDQQKNKGVNE